MDRRKIIYQDDAIDALCKSECGCNNAECGHRDNTDFCVTCDNVKIIKSLPSAQPETNCSEFPNSSDTISRQQSIDALRKMQTYKLFAGDDMLLIDQAEAQTELMMLPSVQPEQRWVPCSEQLPEKEGWYITTVENEKTGKRRIENDLFAIDIALAHGHTPNKFCKDGYRQRTVAWMPFPEPYQERGEQ